MVYHPTCTGEEVFVYVPRRTESLVKASVRKINRNKTYEVEIMYDYDNPRKLFPKKFTVLGMYLEHPNDVLFEVERILGHRDHAHTNLCRENCGQIYDFRVKWKDYNEHHNSYEPEDGLVDCKESVVEYLRQHWTLFPEHYIESWGDSKPPASSKGKRPISPPSQPQPHSAPTPISPFSQSQPDY